MELQLVASSHEDPSFVEPNLDPVQPHCAGLEPRTAPEQGAEPGAQLGGGEGFRR